MWEEVKKTERQLEKKRLEIQRDYVDEDAFSNEGASIFIGNQLYPSTASYDWLNYSILPAVLGSMTLTLESFLFLDFKDEFWFNQPLYILVAIDYLISRGNTFLVAFFVNFHWLHGLLTFMAGFVLAVHILRYHAATLSCVGTYRAGCKSTIEPLTMAILALDTMISSVYAGIYVSEIEVAFNLT